MNRSRAMVGISVVTLALFAVGCGASDDSIAATSGPAMADPERTTEFDHTVEFVSPTGNIHCAMSPAGDGGEEDFAECGIGEATWSPPPQPEDCELDWASTFAVSTTGPAEPVCRGDYPFGEQFPQTLPYGDAVLIGEVRCDSAETGVSCRSTRTGNGFALSKAALVFF